MCIIYTVIQLDEISNGKIMIQFFFIIWNLNIYIEYVILKPQKQFCL